jgi:hypothetical protein
MLVTEHVSGIIMPIIRSTGKADKLHTVFCGYNHSHQVHTGSTSSPQVHYCTISAEHRMRFVIPSCIPDDGHNDA